MANLLTADPQTAAGETLTIEADTVEAALAQLTERVGPGAKILSADRIRRGGVAGFFAREVIQLVAEVSPPSRDGVNTAFARMLAAVDSENDTAIDEGEASLPPPPVAPVPVIVPEPVPAIDPDGGVRWSTASLLRLGMPASVVNRLAHLETDDDLGHLSVLSSILSNLCGDLPEVPVTTLGPRSAFIRHESGLEEGEGPLHLVVGDGDLPAVMPAIVSWSSPTAAPRAIALAVATGATLGFGITTHASAGARFGAVVERIRPVEAALVLRSLMERA